MKVLDLPELDRPRERLLNRGAAALSDRELLALVLGSGLPGCDAIELAAVLIGESGGVAALATADPHALKRLPGVGAAKAARVAAAFELARRAAVPEGRRRIVTSSDVAAVAATYLRGLRHERVVVIACDTVRRHPPRCPTDRRRRRPQPNPGPRCDQCGPRSRRNELRGSAQPPERHPGPQPARYGSDSETPRSRRDGGCALPRPRNRHRNGMGQDSLKPPAKRRVKERKLQRAEDLEVINHEVRIGIIQSSADAPLRFDVRYGYQLLFEGLNPQCLVPSSRPWRRSANHIEPV